MPANTVTIDREIVEQFIVEVDALASFDMLRNGRQEAALVEHIYEIIEPFERAALGRLSEEESGTLHERAHERARALGREWFGYLFEPEEVGASA